MSSEKTRTTYYITLQPRYFYSIRIKYYLIKRNAKNMEPR
jgi:hypothetical protein